MTREPTPHDIAYYEGLVCKTSLMYVDFVEEDLDDFRQILRVKVWRALGTFSSDRSRLSVQKYVFGCVRNQVKDLLKKRRHTLFYFEALDDEHDWARMRFESRHMAIEEEQAFAELLDEGVCLPNTLTAGERQVVVLLYEQFKLSEIARQMSIRPTEVKALIASVQTKLADWAPAPQRQLVHAA